MACQELDLPNVGITMDFGHAVLAHENPAQAAALAARYGRLFNVHLNDTFGRFDDDFLPATKHVMETVELLWQLKQLDYNGWISLDMSRSPGTGRGRDLFPGCFGSIVGKGIFLRQSGFEC